MVPRHVSAAMAHQAHVLDPLGVVRYVAVVKMMQICYDTKVRS